MIVAEEGGAAVGVLHVFERPALDKGCEAVVQAMVVDDACRSHGVGVALIRAAEAWAVGRGLGATALYTRTPTASGRDPSTNAWATVSRPLPI